MAENNDRDDDEKDEKAAEGAKEEAEEKAAPAPAKAAPAGKKAPPAASSDDDDDDNDDEDDDEDDAPKPAPKPAAKPMAAKRGAAPLAKGRTAPARKGGSLGKSMLLFVIIVGSLAAAFAYLGREENTGPQLPKWKVGDTADLDLTLIADDKKNLACAVPDAIGGSHCAFEAQNKPWSKGDSSDDKKLLKPYTTVDHVQILAAGLWSDAALMGALPTVRFTVKCKFKVEGKAKSASLRWAPDGAWNDVKDLSTGSLSGCKVVQ